MSKNTGFSETSAGRYSLALYELATEANVLNEIEIHSTSIIDLISNVVTTAGTGYAVGDELVIQGTDLGGDSPANDLTITVDTIDSIGGVATVSESGSAVDGNGTFNDTPGQNEAPTGGGASFNVTRNSGIYTLVVSTSGNNYKVGNRIVLQGTDLGGAQPDNNLTELSVSG